jgi:polyisoprenoid-binding protein YceI
MQIKTMMMAFAAAATLAGAEYKIDTAHSGAGFSVKHLMVSNVKGQFSKIAGTINYDEKDPSATVVEATIDVTTVNTNEPKRDAHLKSADFFEVEKYPAMTFKSKKAAKGGRGLLLTGDLTLHGVTKEVTLDVEVSPEIKGMRPNTFVRGANATGKINRKDFGLTWNRALEAGGVVVGDEVQISIDIEAMRATAN